MKNYQYKDTNSGEIFFIQATSREKAAEIAADYFDVDALAFCGVYSDYEAEMLGYDTY